MKIMFRKRLTLVAQEVVMETKDNFNKKVTELLSKGYFPDSNVEDRINEKGEMVFLQIFIKLV